ncbi:hypothetical protein [Leptolyngbya sp. Cla-17]|nr:hypothetical protein [Leptolyngbya sp. Cla-17]
MGKQRGNRDRVANQLTISDRTQTNNRLIARSPVPKQSCGDRLE